MAGLTSAQRYNKRMEKIWEKAEKLGAFSEENLKKAREHEEKERKKKMKVYLKLMKEQGRLKEVDKKIREMFK
jgi:uncharacterized membrane protein YqiK